MSRIPIVAADDLPEEARAVLEEMTRYGPFGNLGGALAHRPPILRHVFGMLLELRDEAQLPRRALELALVTVSKLNECTYCVSHHAPMLAVEGMSTGGIARLPDTENHQELDECDRAVVRYAEAVTTRANRMKDAEVTGLRAWFTDTQIAELTWRIALCGAFNRFNDALQLALEDGVEEIPASV
jgi:uncharacterized peroxidase-related enzyme